MEITTHYHAMPVWTCVEAACLMQARLYKLISLKGVI